MSKKTTRSRGPSSFIAAAAQAGVSVGEFKMWVAEYRDFSGDRWTKWNHGSEPIPKDVIIEFLRAKIAASTRERGDAGAAPGG